MSLNRPQHDFQRARSGAQKNERRSDILRAARLHLADVGVDGFSLAPLAQQAGVSRASMYLYFANREEVLLELYVQETRAWLDDLTAVTQTDMGVDAYLRAVFTSATQRPLFMQLAPRVTSIMEREASIESLAEIKRLAATLVQVAGEITAGALGRPIEQGYQIALGLFALMLGITQALWNPRRDIAALSPDVRHLFEGEEPVEAFVRFGRWLVAGSVG